MRNLPPLSELRAFEAAARHLSFKRAAAELGVTPTAISHQIKLLETHCGRALFRRRPQPLTLTWAGEQLFPVVRDGLESFAEVLATVRAGATGGRLRVTATNAFAARWLVPRLPQWRQAHPTLKLDIAGTDAVLDLEAGEADVAIRYALKPPTGGICIELLRDTFHVVASPKLVGKERQRLSPSELAQFPLLEAEWPPADTHAPNWRRWQLAAQARHKCVPNLAAIASFSFREELHTIEAAIAGQGIALCSEVLIGPELASGALLPVSPITLSGYGFYIVHRAKHPKQKSIKALRRLGARGCRYVGPCYGSATASPQPEAIRNKPAAEHNTSIAALRAIKLSAAAPVLYVDGELGAEAMRERLQPAEVSLEGPPALHHDAHELDNQLAACRRSRYPGEKVRLDVGRGNAGG